MKYAVVTFGCRVNQADSLVIEGELRARGGREARPEIADLVVVNTCSVTANADQGARQTIRRIVRSNPDVRVVVTGCYATRRPDELRELPNVTRVITNPEKDHLVELIGDDTELSPVNIAGTISTAERFGGGDGPCGDTLVPGVGGRTALTLRVQTGCEEQCSYCIIPQTRGAVRSLALSKVVERIGHAVAAGYKEIVITGVHLGSYGRDLDDDVSLTTLVRALADYDDDVLFRISSLEPMDCGSELVDIVAGSSRVAPHFHLPLQHGCDSVLTAMRRPYTSGYYRALVDRIHQRMPDASIGSDIIVGFPGEANGHFDEMLGFLEELPLSHLHVFPYSDRPGTAAAKMPGTVEGAVIRARGRVVREIGERKVRRFRATQAGSVRRALTVDDGWSAVTDNYLKVRLGTPQPRNEWVTVRLGADSTTATVI